MMMMMIMTTMRKVSVCSWCRCWSHFQTQPLLKSDHTPPLLLLLIHHHHQNHHLAKEINPDNDDDDAKTNWRARLRFNPVVSAAVSNGSPAGDLMASTDNQFATPPLALLPMITMCKGETGQRTYFGTLINLDSSQSLFYLMPQEKGLIRPQHGRHSRILCRESCSQAGSARSIYYFQINALDKAKSVSDGIFSSSSCLNWLHISDALV